MSRAAQATPIHDLFAFRASAGEMGLRILAFDCFKPPLGPAPFSSPVLHAPLLKGSGFVGRRFTELRGSVNCR